MILDLMADIDVSTLLRIAWTYRERALISGRTRVGAAALAADGTVYGGCNVQHRFRSGDVHAEVNAITTMLAEGRRRLAAVAVVAECEGLAPCGGCLDWILQVGGNDCVVVWQGRADGPTHRRPAVELMPFHPPYEDQA
jgi:cytidine deaminase